MVVHFRMVVHSWLRGATQGGSLALTPFRLSKLGMVSPFLAPLSVGMGSFFRCGSQISSPFLDLSPPFWESIKNQIVSISKIILDTQWIDQKNMLFNTHLYKHVALVQGKLHIAKKHFFRNFGLPHFYTVLPSAARSSKKIMCQGARFQGFWTSWPILSFKEPKNFVRDASQNNRVLLRVVCLCGAVGVCRECHGVK